ncbi:DUF389 domain-containing protein [Vallicoccus soli]|uniref:DUF389 domain-containing protein n=1 Tax=Vallicoccus soli TaxID=2339232 RepID=A0A3A3Z0N5_9ACTN|nr:DUF389 domain-containing protein [Vallicoccus soli]RJK96071.1 DUF389 domain-containing protein [Vallicoccus soli]
MLHLRLIVPPDRTPAVHELLARHEGVTHVVHLPGAAVQPPGDVVTADVAREAADSLVEDLTALGVAERGALTLDAVDLSVSRGAREAEEEAPGHGSDAIVWEQVAAGTQEESTLSVTFLALMAIATVLAGIGVLLDSPILVIGAMVVGPEFGPTAGTCVALVQRRWRPAARSATALLVGFPVGALATVLSTWLLTWWGLVDRSLLEAPRPLTDFIWRPDALSFVVALLAGVAGTLSLTSAKSGALVGVVISVTTVPAAANAAVAVAYGVADEAVGSAVQLVLNLAGIVLACLLTLLVQRRAWARRGAGLRPRTGAGAG